MPHLEPSPEQPLYPHGNGAKRPAQGPAGFGIERAARAILRRWWYPVLSGAALYATAWLWLPEDMDRYRAHAVVRLDDARQALTGGIAGASWENVRTPEFMISQVHVVRSQAVLGEVVDGLGLRLQPPSVLHGRLAEPSVQGSPRSSELQLEFDRGGFAVRAGEASAYGLYGEPLQIDGVRFTIQAVPPVDSAAIRVISREAAIQLLTLGLSAAPRERTSIIDIMYTATDAEHAQRVANAVALAYQRHNMTGVREAAKRRREFIESQWQAAEARHDSALARLNAFRSIRGRSGAQDRLRQQQAGLLALDGERQRLDEERRVFQSFLERVNQAAADDGIYNELRTLVLAPGIIPSPLLSQLYNQVTQHQEERVRQLAAGRAPTHPDVERLTRLISSAHASVVDAARAQLASLDLRIVSLDEQRTRSAMAVEGLPSAEAEDLSLVQDVNAARGMADALRGEYHRAQIEEAVDAGQAEIIDFATGAAPMPAGRRTQKLTLAAMLGVMLGCVALLGIEATDRSIRWRGEMEELSALPALAVIPRVFSPPRRFRRWFARRDRASAPESDGAGNDRLAATDFHTVGAEAYRILRTNLTFLWRSERLGTLSITSAQSGEGKSTTAANLATSMARQSLRVLLVDCDLRRPRQHRIFGVGESGPGFVDVLLRRALPTDAVYVTGVQNLWLMPRGAFDERAAELLGSQAMRELMALVRKDYDVVIFDTPPALVAADAPAVAALTDGVLLVVRAGRTTRAAVRQTLQQLNAVGAHTVGFVLNDPDTVADKYGEYAYSKQYYTVESG